MGNQYLYGGFLMNIHRVNVPASAAAHKLLAQRRLSLDGYLAVRRVCDGEAWEKYFNLWLSTQTKLLHVYMTAWERLK